jgi:hypothetical protein
MGREVAFGAGTDAGGAGELQAAQRDAMWARRFAWLGSGGALFALMALRDLAASAFSWQQAAGGWIWFGSLFVATVMALGLCLVRAWNVKRRMGVVPATAWWAAIVLVAMAGVIGDVVVSRLGP